jgi:hypothetical protein
MAGYAGGETAASDKLISLNMQNKPLGEVLDLITESTGHAFIIDEKWRDFPVSLEVKAVPLHKVLKKVFANLNNAIIYKSDGSIKILVYSESVSGDAGSAPQTEKSVNEAPSSQEMERESDTSEPTDQEGETEDITEDQKEDESTSGDEQTSESEKESEEKDDEESEEKDGISTKETNEGQEEGTPETSEN